MAARRRKTKNHDDVQEHLEVERPLQNERMMTMLLNTKLCELVVAIVEKPAASDAEAGRNPSVSTA